MTTTLHIRHAISDFDVWTAAFDAFAEARRRAGVLEHRVRRPIDDPRYVVIDLTFAAAGEAEAFRAFLQANVWSTPANSPALLGSPETMILEDASPAAVSP